jgi:hypothetical protein
MNHQQGIKKIQKYATFLQPVFVLMLITHTMLYATGGNPTGSGTTEDPFLIADYADLKVVGTTMTYTLSAVYRLTADIDASASSTEHSDSGFVPIGDNTTNFSGVFHGAGHVIKNLHINHPGLDYVGLFGICNYGAVIDSLGVINADMTGRDDIGCIVGSIGMGTSGGTISNCYATGSVIGRNNVGCVVGDNEGTISNCYATGLVRGNNSVGGFVGTSGGTIGNCYATGNVNGYAGLNTLGGIDPGSYVGGFVGSSGGASTISNCYATGNVIADTSMSVGGFVGYSGIWIYTGHGIISNCHATGLVRGYMSVGGFVGTSDAARTANCYATGTVIGVRFSITLLSNSGWEVGGFVGTNCAPIMNCYALGSASGSGHIGGFAGEHSDSIMNCYAIGSATGDNRVGGVVGYIGSTGTISNCYWDQQASGNASGYGFIDTGGVISGTGLTTAQMKQSSSFSGWDFTTVWSINSSINNGYPNLASSKATSVTGKTFITPKTFSLLQNYPNPFNPTTTISFTLAQDGFTTLKIYNVLGREIATLINENLRAGVLHQITFKASLLSSGMYFYKLESGKQMQVKKLLLMK